MAYVMRGSLHLLYTPVTDVTFQTTDCGCAEESLLLGFFA
jgi:hypothetical protein